MREPGERSGIMLYRDVFDPIIDCCTPDEIGTLIIALFMYERGEELPSTLFKDRMLQLAFNTIKASSDRDNEAYLRKCCTNAVVALYKKWKSERKAAGQSDDKEIFLGEMVDEIAKTRRRYNYQGELSF